MDQNTKATLQDGDEVMKAVGELSVTAKEAAKTISETHIDHEEAQTWIKMILETVMKFLK